MAETASTTCYLINRCSSSAISFKTSKEKWSNNSPSYQNLMIFDNNVFIHEIHGKLDPKAMKCAFLGYPQCFKGYKLWILYENKTKISHDVIFNELESYKTNM